MHTRTHAHTHANMHTYNHEHAQAHTHMYIGTRSAHRDSFEHPSQGAFVDIPHDEGAVRAATHKLCTFGTQAQRPHSLHRYEQRNY